MILALHARNQSSAAAAAWTISVGVSKRVAGGSVLRGKSIALFLFARNSNHLDTTTQVNFLQRGARHSTSECGAHLKNGNMYSNKNYGIPTISEENGLARADVIFWLVCVQHQKSENLLSNQRNRTRGGEKRSHKNREVAKTLQQASAKRPPLTLFRICLLIVAMICVLIGMNWWQFKRIRWSSEARMEEIEPIGNTTFEIESSAWELRLWGIRNPDTLPTELSDALPGKADGWGRPMRIEHEGDPLTGYKISSAGADGEFDTSDDIAIRFSMDHKQVERINTHGLEEMNAETDSLFKSIGMDTDLLLDVVDEKGSEQQLGVTPMRTANPADALARLQTSSMNLADIYRQQGELEKAISKYRDTLRINSDYAPAHRGIGDAFRQQGKLDQALKEFRTAIRLDPNLPVAQNNLAWALVTNPQADGSYRDLPEAIASAKMACELDLDNYAYLNTLGVSLYRSGDWKEAIDSLQDSVDLGADMPHNWLFIAMSQWQLGDKEQARTLYDKSIAWREKTTPMRN